MRVVVLKNSVSKFSLAIVHYILLCPATHSARVITVVISSIVTTLHVHETRFQTKLLHSAAQLLISVLWMKQQQIAALLQAVVRIINASLQLITERQQEPQLGHVLVLPQQPLQPLHRFSWGGNFDEQLANADFEVERAGCVV